MSNAVKSFLTAGWFAVCSLKGGFMASGGRSVFAERLGRVLEYQNLSQAELARQLNVSRATVHAWCTGSAQPLLGRFEELADVLGVRKAYLLGEEDRPVRIPADYKRMHHTLLSESGIDKRQRQKSLDELSNYLCYLRSRTRRKAP
jgi:transcriptional regulator with XRE-family HTH domain